MKQRSIQEQADKLLERAPQQEAEEVQVPYIGKDKKQRTVPWIRRSKPAAPPAQVP